LATFQIATVVDSRRNARPTAAASEPVTTTIVALATSRTPVTTVTPNLIDSVFQIGRPSGTS
jgi:hypothetical protein